MRSQVTYGTAFLAFLFLQQAVAWKGSGEKKTPASTDATLSIMADRLIPEEDLVAAINHVLEVGEYVEVLSLEEDKTRSGTAKGWGKKVSKDATWMGRGLLFAPAPPDLPQGTTVSMRADQQGTGQKPNITAALERLFTTAAFQREDSILGHTGFGLQRPPQKFKTEDNSGGLNSNTLQPAASLLQTDTAETLPGSMRLWDASVAEAQRRGVPVAGLYLNAAASEAPTAAQATVQTGFGLQKKPLRGSNGQQPLTDDSLFASSPSAALSVRPGPAVAALDAATGSSLMAQMGIGLEKPPTNPALSDSALAFAPVQDSKPVAAMSAAAGGGIDSLRTLQHRQQTQAAGAAAANGADGTAGAGPGAAGAPPLSARRRRLAAWGDNVAEVKDDTWARDGWRSGASSASGARSGAAKRGTNSGRRAKLGLSRPERLPIDDVHEDDEEEGFMSKLVREQGAGGERSRDARARLATELVESVVDSDREAYEDAMRALPKGRALPLVGQAKKGGDKGPGKRKKQPRRPFQPKNEAFLSDAFSASVDASLEKEKKKANRPVDIVELVTGYRQVPMDPKDIDQDTSGSKAKGGRWQERKGEASGKGDVMAKGKEESALELEGYISQQATIRLVSPDSKVLDRLKSHRVLGNIKQTLRDMGISAADVAVLPKVQGNADKGSDARAQQKPVMSRGLLAASDASKDAQRKLPSSLVSAIQAAAGFVYLKLPSEHQANEVMTTA